MTTHPEIQSRLFLHQSEQEDRIRSKQRICWSLVVWSFISGVMIFSGTDDEFNTKTFDGNLNGSKVINKNAMLTGSYSQPSMAELSSGGNTARENIHDVEPARFRYSILKHSFVGASGGARELFHSNKQSISINNESTLKYRRESSTSSDEIDLWEEKQREDVVGDLVTRMLNSGDVPHFGYTHSSKTQFGKEDDVFHLSPLFSSNNFRVARSYVLSVLLSLKNNNSGSLSEQVQIIRSRDTRSMRFILETFAAAYIAVYSLNDILLRSLTEFILLTIVGNVVSILFDVDEIKYVARSLFQSILPVFISDILERMNAIARRMLVFFDVALLWGYHFQGRVLLWSDEGMLVKFRREHKRLITTHNERRKKRKAVRKMKEERRRKIKRGETLTPLEVEEMETEIRASKKLDADFKEFAIKTPTYLSDNVVIRIDTDSSRRSYATRCHLESLQYCQQMILLVRDRNEPKLHSSQLANDEERDFSSPVCSKESIELVNELPGVSTIISFEHHHRRLSQLSDEDEDDRFPFSDIYSLSDDGIGSNYSSGKDDDDDDHATSEGSYASDSSHRSMPWMVVGAKIGHKLLNARKLRRLTMSNPDAAQKLIPEEAKKLIDGISKDRSRESYPSPSKSKSQDDSDSIDDVSDRIIPFLSSPSKSNEQLEIKRPIHRMWTSAGSAAKIPNTFGAVALAMSPTDDQSVSSYVELSQAGLHSNDNTPSRQSLLNGRRAPPPSPEIENSSNHFSPVRRGSPSFIRHMPTLMQTGTSGQNVDIVDPAPRIPVTRLAPLEKGVKMAVPIFPLYHQSKAAMTSGPCFYQMGTVISSRRIYVAPNNVFRPRKQNTNCLSIKVFLDKALLRGSKFVEMELRVMDEWNQIPRHSKFPLGSCVATTFGVGILVGWRVEDDIHIIRSLWKRSGPGSGVAFLRRDSIHGVVEAAVGFDVQTTYGAGRVLAYTQGGYNNLNGKYFVQLKGRLKNQVMEFHRCQILSCQGAIFVPVTEHIRAAALYRLEILQYKAKLRENMLNCSSNVVRNKGMWRNFSEYVDLFATSFGKAIAEDPDFDSEFDKFFSHIINLLDGEKGDDDFQSVSSQNRINNTGFFASSPEAESNTKETVAKESWNINDMLACLFGDPKKDDTQSSVNNDTDLHAQAFDEAHESAMIFIRVLTRTVTVAQASVPDRPRLHIALAMIHETLLLVRQILRVQQKHTSKKLVEAWFRALNEISSTFGPLKQRAAALGVQIAKKFRKHDSIAKRRILRFVDIVLGDTQLLHALELVDWKQALSRLEVAIVKSGIIDDTTREQLHRGALLVYKNLAPRKKDRKSKAAAARNGQKINNLAKFIKIVASPGRSILRLLTTDEVLVHFDRVLMRIFEKDPHYSMVINIYAFNFESIRHLRTLNNLSIAGKLWETVLDALDEEATFAMAEIPEQSKYFVAPFVKLFSLGVSHFHIRQSGGSNADWLDFLMEDEAVKIIQELDYKLIDSLEALCNDMKQVVQVLPYIKTIDNDILNLIDEFDFDLFLKDISNVIGHSEKWLAYITERSTIMVERFLDYLPRMSIPIERRELQDGWVLTCRSKDGGDLRLSDLSVLRENMLLSVFGSDNVFHPLSEPYKYVGSPKNNGITLSVSSDLTDDTGCGEESVLDEVRELILSAKMHGAWTAGIGGLKMTHHNERLPRELRGLPMTDNLKAQIDRWQALEVSDFDLLETAIREVSFQIQLQKEREEDGEPTRRHAKNTHKLFNPRLDSTVLFLDIQNLTLRLEDFSFRVERGQPMTIFDPVFEGRAGILVKNVSITLQVKVEKERFIRDGVEISRPVLQLSMFDVKLEKLKLKFMQTGADWILNAVLKGFDQQITAAVEENLKEQIMKQVHILLEQVNGLIESNPDLLMNALGITIKDLEESTVYV